MKTLLRGLIIGGILLNGGMPRLIIETPKCEPVRMIVKNQAVFLQVFSLSTLPIKIVSELMEEGNVLRCKSGEERPKEAEGKNSDTSSEYSIVNTEKRAGQLRYENVTGRAGSVAGPVSAIELAGITGPGSVSGNSSPPLVVFAVFFGLFLLPRSSIGEGAAAIRNNGILISQPAGAGWVFSFEKINTLNRSLP